jgi:hypothetical protein
MISFRGEQDFALAQDDSGSIIIFGSGSSVHLVGSFLTNLDELQYLYI